MMVVSLSPLGVIAPSAFTISCTYAREDEIGCKESNSGSPMFHLAHRILITFSGLFFCFYPPISSWFAWVFL